MEESKDLDKLMELAKLKKENPKEYNETLENIRCVANDLECAKAGKAAGGEPKPGGSSEEEKEE